MSKFKFADQLGFSPPIVFEEDVNQDRKGFYRLYIDFEELVKAIEVSKKEKALKAFNYEDYKSDKEKVFKFEDPESGEVVETIITVNAPFTVEDETGKERNLRLYGRLNKKIANVKTDIFIIRISIEPKKNRVSYALLLIYEGFDGRKNNSNRSDENRVAIEINTYTYEDYKAAIAYLGYRNDQVEEAIVEKFNEAFDLAQKDIEQLTFLYNRAPAFVLEHRDEDKKWQDLDLLLSGFVRNRKERAILRLLRGLAIDESKINAEEGGEKKRQFTRRVDNFFYRLMLGGKGKNTFESLYEKLNDYGIGDPNFTALIQELYKFWSLSSFTDPLYEKNKPYTGGNEVIAYDDKKILGFHTNSYNLDFVTDKSRLKVKVTKDEVVFKEKKYSRRPSKGIEKVDVGVYNLFQPITLMDVPKESEVKIPTNVIPAFYLKAVHDKNTWSNVDKGIWLGVDVVTTLTGIGNLAKLRHLRHLGKLKKLTPLIRVKTAVSVVEVFSGTLNIMLKLADSKSPFAQKLQTYLFWLEMLSLGADVVVEKLLKNSAREALEAIDEVAKLTKDTKKLEELDVVSEHLLQFDNIARNLDSVRLSKLDIKQWINRLEKAGTKVRFAETSKKMKKYFKEEKVGASFDPFEVPPTIWIRKDATDLELFHEAMHFEDFLRRGKLNYIRGEKRDLLPFGNLSQIPERDQLISSYIKEKFVLDKILEEQQNWIEKFGRGRFTPSDINFSKRYLNTFVEDLAEFGIDANNIIIKQ